MDVKIINNSTQSVNGWQLTLNFSGAPRVTNSWNATVNETATQVVASNLSWNANLGSGQSASFGFQGNLSDYLDTPSCIVKRN